MLREVDMMTALEVTLQGGTAIRVLEAQNVASMTVGELMRGEGYRYFVDDTEESPETERAKADETLENALENALKNDTPSPEPENVSENPSPIGKNHSGPRVDVGKIHALYDAGWSVAKISDEMHISTATVRKYVSGIALESKEDDE